jgi:elongation factor 1-beta
VGDAEKMQLVINAIIVILKDLKMADVIIKLKIMPSGPDVNLEKIKVAAENKIKKFGASVIHSINEEPVAFGLKALIFVFLINEQKSNIENLENDIKTIPNVNSVEVIDVRRAIG